MVVGFRVSVIWWWSTQLASKEPTWVSGDSCATFSPVEWIAALQRREGGGGSSSVAVHVILLVEAVAHVARRAEVLYVLISYLTWCNFPVARCVVTITWRSCLPQVVATAAVSLTAPYCPCSFKQIAAPVNHYPLCSLYPLITCSV